MSRFHPRDLWSAFLDLFVRYIPDVEPITFDAERIQAGHDRAEAATVEYLPGHPKYRDDSPSLGMPMRTVRGRTYRPRADEPKSATTAHDCLTRKAS